MCFTHFQVIISPAFPYWKPIVSDWFPWETCQFSFIFQFATASVQPCSLCWIIKSCFLGQCPASQLQTYDLAAKSTMWYIDMLQNCGNLAIHSRLSEMTEMRREVFSCCLCHNFALGWSQWELFKSLSSFLPPLSSSQRQTGSEQSLSWCINYVVLLLSPTWTIEGKMGALSLSMGNSIVLLLSSQRQKVQQIRCQMIFNVKRACLFPWHPLLGALLHGTDTPLLSIQVSSNGTQVRGGERKRTYGKEEEQR